MQDRKSRISRNALILAFVALASGFGQDLIAPILPGYLLLLGLSRADIGLIDGLLEGTTNICRFLSGWLSDRFHQRKRFVFWGYTLSSVARPLLALTSSFMPIALLRMIDGAGKGTKDAPRDTLVAEGATPGTSGRVFGFQRMIDTAGSVIGPLLAFGLLALLLPTLATYRFIFSLAVIPGAIALALIWFGVQESPAPSRRNGSTLPKLSWRFWVFIIASSLVMLTKINDSLMLVRAEDLGISNTWIPLLFGGFTLIYAIASYPIGIWSDRIGKLPLLAAGWLVLAAVEYGFSFHPSLITTIILFAGYGTVFALTEGSARAFIADAVHRDAQGGAYSVYYTSLGLSLIIGGYLLGLVWDRETPQIAFRIAAAGSLVGSLILLSLLRKTSKTV